MRKYFKLIACLVFDFIGYLSFSIPVIGEGFDFIWAPISSVVLYLLFKSNNKSAYLASLNLMEELLPGLDFIPSFTIMWFINELNSKPAKHSF